MHQASVELLLEDAETNPLAPLYGKDDVLPIDILHPQKMDLTGGSLLPDVGDD